MKIDTEIQALAEIAESVLLDWLDIENLRDRRRLKAFELVAEATSLLRNAYVNLSAKEDE